jgi:L-aminopeptidase/D-esterase-like protein
MSITAVPGIRVGHWTNLEALTGCTVILPPPQTIAGVHIPGNAPATRETDAIAPGRRVKFVHAIVLTGGSAFGLGAADGAMRWLEERGIGHDTPFAKVPIVPTAAIYDLLIGDPRVRPGPADAYAACDSASETEAREGNIGAGTGATVGKSAGFEHMSKGGLGTASARDGELIVGALAVVNAVGDVIGEDGAVIAGARAEPLPTPPPERTATTIACVATNAALSSEDTHALAVEASSGLGRAIRPAYTMWDGDTVFALATGSVQASVARAAGMAADVLAEAVRRAVRAATTVAGIPALGKR